MGILFIPSLYEKFESFTQSVATSWGLIMCALVQGRVSLLTPFMKSDRGSATKWFKSCFLHYWLSTSGKFLNLSIPQFPHLQKGDDTLVLLWLCVHTDLGYWTLQSARSDCLQASSRLRCVWLCARSSFLIPTQALKLHIFRKVKPCFIFLN